MSRPRPSWLALVLSIACLGEALAQSVTPCQQPSICAVCPLPPALLQSCGGGSFTLPMGCPGDPGYSWKACIRSHMASLSQADFDLCRGGNIPQFLTPTQVWATGTQVASGPCTVSWGSLTPTQRLHIEQLWMITALPDRRSNNITFDTLTTPASRFTLSAIEDTVTGTVMWPDSLLGQHGELAGELGLRRQSLRLRPSAVPRPEEPHGRVARPPDDHARLAALERSVRTGHPPTSGPSNQGYELGGHLRVLAWTYLQVKDAIPVAVRSCYEQALAMYCDRLDAWGHWHQQTNLSIRATYALYLAWLATGDPMILAQYQQVTNDPL